ncbi:YihY family inner membrane protein [Orrella sp. JC864]|uniref:YihY family inner membrane protein n=1 Tax=Orrella sp. JC864 TaxID=3120298 RepID=UPI0012BB7FB0
MEQASAPSHRTLAVPKAHVSLPWHRRVGKLLRFALARAGQEKLLQVASSLTFTTVLAIVPMLAVVLSLFTAFPLFNDFRMALETFLANNLMPPAVSDNIMDYLNQFAMQASRLTTIGGLFLIVTSIMLIMTIDMAFNDIWHVTRQRPLPQRALVYWAVLSLGPVLAGASLWATSMLARESMGLVGELSRAAEIVLSFLPVLLTALGFAALFVVVPNRRVEWKDALAGGLCTAVLLEITKRGFALYITNFPTYTVIYGAFATVPVFLLWIYVSWLAVLLGASMAASLPLIRLGRWNISRRPGAEFIDAVGVLRALYAVRGQVPAGLDGKTLAATLRLHQDELADVLQSLSEMGLVARGQARNRDVWVLSCDPRTATLAPLVDRFLIDRNQRRLENEPEILEAIAPLLVGGKAAVLETIIDTAPPAEPPLEPKAPVSAQAKPEPATGSTETIHAQSQ